MRRAGGNMVRRGGAGDVSLLPYLVWIRGLLQQDVERSEAHDYGSL